MTPDLSGKRLELLKEIVPNVSAVALLFNPEDPLSVLDSEGSRIVRRKRWGSGFFRGKYATPLISTAHCMTPWLQARKRSS